MQLFSDLILILTRLTAQRPRFDQYEFQHLFFLGPPSIHAITSREPILNNNADAAFVT